MNSPGDDDTRPRPDSASSSGPDVIPDVDTTVPHTGRVWNYWLGGTDNFAADRELGDRIREFLPTVVELARADRAFLGRAVTHLVRDAGIRQFLDVGSGLPTADNTHEVAQAAAPEARIVYVDNDPLIHAHARALLASTPEGGTDYIHGDLLDADAVLQAAARTLDLNRPIALTMLGVVEHIPDSGDPYAVVGRLVDALPSGSYLVLAHDTNVVHGEVSDEAVRRWNESATPPITLRSPEQIARFFTGLEVLEPGVVSTSRWRPEPGPDGAAPPEVDAFCAVGRKP
ncbi:translation initiation factor IF-2 [Streptomonospora alba]|uniref:Translation initiation factor IF-2 n=1 Tax=Streptomonospora alba TaxID=183763 RepID=A0A0C2FE64_9ACTN|nr:SAM-dependent methyltransferase [Streptomonospora alba]KIH97494.1 translation initiation factor IF-2 [Streptomonospora alba]